MPYAGAAQAAKLSDAGAFRGEPLTASVEELRAGSAAMPLDPEFEAQILLEEGVRKVAADGTASYRYRLIFRIDSSEALHNWAEISRRWDPWNEKPAQLRARVLQADGKFVELDQKTITDAPVKADDSETFSSEHVRRAPLPGLALGAIVEEVEEVEEKSPYFAGGSVYRFQFGNGVPTGRSRFVIELPSALPYEQVLRQLSNAVVSKTETDGRRRVEIGMGPLPGLFNSDIDLATNTPQRALIEVATGASWGAVAKDYAAMADPQTVTEEAKRILPSTLPADRTKKIAVIVAELHKQVRYTGVEFGSAKLTPERPQVVIQRHYGDCKDKATLLVAMLRAAGISAHLALLSVGPGIDVSAELPGMSQFDHAIVYVPAEGSSGALWIDATAEYFAPGSLPFGDEGRMALVIAPETKALTRTPGPTAEDSQLVETRVFTLKPHGPSAVVETSETRGIVDANYRTWFGGEDIKKIHENLEGYSKQMYRAKSLGEVHHGPTADVTEPFSLRLDIVEAKRGFTALDDAVVAVFPSMVVEALPEWFRKEPFVVGPDTSAEEKRRVERAVAARVATYTFRPYREERIVRIVPPAGFVLRSLPPAKTTALGLGSMSEAYRLDDKGVVIATYTYDTGPGSLTAAQALAMRTAVLELDKREYVGVSFDQVGAKEMRAGHIREALAADRALIVANSNEALPHVEIARALLKAGIGDEAHVEAKRATEVDPKLAVAYSTLGWCLQHDSLGERWGKGFDLSGALSAYRKALELDPDDNDTRFDLAVLYEVDARGMRYEPDADMKGAIATYKDLIEREKDTNEAAANQARDNLYYALLFTKNFKELDTMLAKAPFSNAHASLAISSVTAQHGVAAGIAEADKGNAAGANRNANLTTAGSQLARLRMYPEAAAILQAGIGGGDAATAARQIELYKSLKKAALEPLPLSDPAAPIQRTTLAMMNGTLTLPMMKVATSQHAYSSDASMDLDLSQGLASNGMMEAMSEKSGLSETVLMDIIAGNMTFKHTGDDQAGYDVTMSIPGSDDEHVYVTREESGYRLVGGQKDWVEVGNEALYALEQKKPKLAKALLDWKRDQMSKGGGDDPLSGPMLPRFWTVDSTVEGADSPEAMRLAAISLLTGSLDAKPYLAEISAARDKATGQKQVNLDLLLVRAANGAEQPEIALPAAKRLMEDEPDSDTAVIMASRSYLLEDDSKNWLAMLAAKIAKRPKNVELLRLRVEAYEDAKDFAAARGAEQAVLDSGKANSSDYNDFAWLALFDDHADDGTLKAAQKSNMMSNNGDFSELHTLACVYAAMGRTTEARQVLKQAMEAGNYSTPNSAVWLALGLIYEQYGAQDAALHAYEKVQAHEFDNHTYVSTTSSYALAQMRIRALKAKG